MPTNQNRSYLTSNGGTVADFLVWFGTSKWWNVAATLAPVATATMTS
ncbi:hypothetical protein [Levilactobacillus yonginensis]